MNGSDASEPSLQKQNPNRSASANHGRLSQGDYSGCEQVTIHHASLSAGDACPDCACADSLGRLYAIVPGKLVRLIGHPLVSGTCYEIEKLRCGLCGEQFSADVPESVATSSKYAPSVGTNLALARYSMGVPFLRVERWQSYHDIPLPDATQWDIVHRLYHRLKPLYEHLQRLSVQADGYYYDETSHQILTVPSSSGKVYTTALASQLGEHWLYIFYTRNQTASQHIEPIISARDTDADFFTMTDASRNNIPRDISADLHARWILCFCLVHGRRKFFELLGQFDQACDFVLQQIGFIYQHEKHCKKEDYDPHQRLLYHQTHSAPVMAALHTWLNNQLLFERTEANSGLGQAIRYMLRHWKPLTRFLHHSGVPIDNSLAERLIKVVIRHRRNSLFYRTERGALVGDTLMSIIHTAARAKVNVFDYLNQLQVHADALKVNPDAWLPWRYQATLAQAAESAQINLPNRVKAAS